MRSLYMAASFWHPSSPQMFSLEVSLITMSTFETRKPRGHVAPNDPHWKLWAAEPMCYFHESFHTFFFFFYSPLLQGTIATTRQEPMLPSCSVKLRLKVTSSFRKLTATLIIVMMFMWREKTKNTKAAATNESMILTLHHIQSFLVTTVCNAIFPTTTTTTKKCNRDSFGRLKVGIRCLNSHFWSFL